MPKYISYLTPEDEDTVIQLTITLVQSTSFIWDKSSKDYKDGQKKTAKFIEFATKIEQISKIKVETGKTYLAWYVASIE